MHRLRGTTIRADLMLLAAAFIWGTAFVAQRAAMGGEIGPMAFNGIRFALGGLVLLPFWRRGQPAAGQALHGWRANAAAVAAGLVLFAGASLQQIGLVHTTAGKAGFITGLYVVLVPLLGLALGRVAGPGAWLGAILAAVGLHLLTVTGRFQIAAGDLWVLGGTLFWAVHILVLDRISPRLAPYRLAAVQSLTCAAGSLATAWVTETTTWGAIQAAAVPILYGGLMSVGIAYTLQVMAQKDAPPAHAAILLSLEAVFAALAGWVLLGELMSARAVGGAGLMLAGMLVSQWVPARFSSWNPAAPQR